MIYKYDRNKGAGNRVDHKELYETMPVRKALLKLIIPTVISQVITVIYNMADTFFIGQLNDPNQVAAVTLTLPLFMFLTALSNLFGVGGSAVIARCLGAGNRERAKHTAAFCVWGAAVLALCYGILLYSLRAAFLPVLGADEGTYDFTCRYIFWIITVGAVPTVLNATLANLIRSEGYSRQASFGVALGGVLNIALDPLFIFALKLDVAGAAIATMLSNLIATVYFLLFLRKLGEQTAITPAPSMFRMNDKIPGEVCISGLPSFIMTLMGTISNATLNYLASTYANTAVAGLGIAKKIDSLAFMIAQGMTQGAISLIAYNYASGNRARMNAAIKNALAITLGVACVILVTLFFGAKVITAQFIDDLETVRYGERFLRINCLSAPTTALNYMIITVFQATKEKTKPLILSFLRKGTLDIPLMLGLNALIGVSGILWATPIADAIALVIGLFLFIPYFKKIGFSR